MPRAIWWVIVTWGPGTRPDGSTAVFPHFVLDRSKPGTVCVDQTGRRFVNESTSYHLFSRAMFEANQTRPTIPCWIITDAGWMAMSRDRGTATQAVDQGYGIACTLDGRPLGDLIVRGANQEHGIVASRSGAMPPELPLGTRLRILPNHACATAAQYDRYHVLPAAGGPLLDWPRFGGW